MIKQIGEVEYEFNCKLGVCIEIKKKFGKSFTEVISNLEKLDVEDLIKFLYCGIDKSITLDNFKENLLDNIGLMELYELVQSFIKQIQYPGLDEEEIDKKIIEKNQKAQTMKSMIS